MILIVISLDSIDSAAILSTRDERGDFHALCLVASLDEFFWTYH